MKTLLIIAGSDPGAGAGLQQDLKTATLLGVYGLTVVTALTVQNTRGLWSVHPVAPELVAVGEIGLTGEIRPVTAVDKRVREAAKLGFRRMIIPAGSRITAEEGLQVVKAGTLAEAVALAL